MEKKLLLLGLLRQQGMHGYLINEFIDHNLSLCTDLKKPTAYYLLDQMCKAGWLTSETEQQGNRPPRRVYRLTAAGEKTFKQLLRAGLSTYQAVQFPGDISLAFLDALDPVEALPLLEQQKAQLVTRLAEIRAVPPHEGSIQLFLLHQLHHLQAELDWIDGVINSLKIKMSEDDRSALPGATAG